MCRRSYRREAALIEDVVVWFESLRKATGGRRASLSRSASSRSAPAVTAVLQNESDAHARRACGRSPV